MHACFEIVWTHKPCAISKNTILLFLPKLCESFFADCTEYLVYMFLFPNRKQIKKNFRHVYILVIQIGSGTPFIVKTSFKGNLVIVWQLAVSEKSEKLKEFHQRTNDFINSRTQKLISNPLDFTFSILKNSATMEIELQKITLNSMTHEIRKFHLHGSK